MLALDSYSNFLVKQPRDSNITRIIQPKIDIQLINDRLQYCQDNHSIACSGGDDPPPSISSRSPASSIESFRLIDLETRQLVRGLKAQHVALSYVWGQDEKGGKFSETLPTPVPNAIEDAITVTRTLGLRYLWIDRYCIDQSNPEEIQEQVSQMDLINNCAYLTITAAAGIDPNHDLPGVGNNVRCGKPHAKIGQHMLISSLPEPIDMIKKSKWFHRSWAYQEGLLSRRRLIFLDDQVYFECSGIYCCEALDFALQELHTKIGKHFRASFCNGLDIGIFQNNWARHLGK
jgi:heterokaryon incompatibility protein (HET)